jgi:hypothetical protein
MLTYTDMQVYLSSWLTGLQYNPLPVFNPGPGLNTDAIDVSPARLVVLSLSSGAGLSTEEVFDRPGVQVRTVGLQMNYSDAEKLAQDIDRGMIAVDSSRYINGKWVLSIVRSGGGPSLLMKDDGDRYHFTCNYIVEVQYG